MDPMKVAAKRRAMRKAGKEPGDMGEKPDRSPDEFVADPAMYQGNSPKMLERQRRAINISISGVDPGPADDSDADDTAEGVAKLHAAVQAAAKRRATRRTKR